MIKMIKKTNFLGREKKILVATLLLAIFLISFASAFGVSTSYWKGKPLTILPGETKIVKLNLQNMVGDKDITVRVSLKQGSGIASVEEKNYLVKTGTIDTSVPVTVTIPLNESAGTEYVVIVSFKTVNNEGGIALGTGIETAFDVLVAGLPKAEEEGKNLILIMISLILIAAILIIIYIFRKKIFKRK